MSDAIKLRIQFVALAFSIAVTFGGWVWLFAGDRRIILDRVFTHDKRLTELELQQRKAGEDLAAIKSDVNWIRRTLERQKP